MSKEILDNMIEISLEKEKMLSEFLNYTKLQGQVIGNNDLEKLDGLLLEKEKLIKIIDKLDIDFLEKFTQIKKLENIGSMEEIDIKKYENIKDLKEVSIRLNDLLKTISKLDGDNTRILSKNLEDVKSELKQVKDAKTAYKGYNTSQAGSIMIDERK